jgi:hypothetical protein
MTVSHRTPVDPATTLDRVPGPYAHPEPHGARDADGGLHGVMIPFVPRPWRGEVRGSALMREQASLAAASAEGAQASLPWIDAYLAADAETADAETADAETTGAPVADRDAVESVAADRSGPSDSDEPAVDEGETWPLDEAGEQVSALAHDLDHVDAADPEPAAEPHPLDPGRGRPVQMWSEDEWMDIMPAKATSMPSDEPTAWAVMARQQAEREVADQVADAAAAIRQAEAAAKALEQLAQRVRTVDLPLPSFHPDLGDAAALAATLAALLGVRR